MKAHHRLGLVLATAALALTVTGTAGAATANHFGNATCRQGTVKTGTYQSLRITGTCTLGNRGTVSVKHDLVVAAHATFNAATPATLNVGGDVWVGDDAIAAIGCSPDVGCAALGHDHVGGNLTADRAWATIVHGTAVDGNVTYHKGGGSEDCSKLGVFGQAPFYFVLEDSSVGGWFSMSQVHSCWFGLIRTTIGGDASLVGNHFGDPDAMEIVTNTVGGDLACFDNRPAPQVGDSGGAPNNVAGRMLGQCKNL